jgi:hypothetical protein
MTKQKALRILNPLLGVLLVAQISAPLLGQVIEMPPYQYQVHTWNGVLIGVLIVLHIILNWPWIKSNYFKKKAA